MRVALLSLLLLTVLQAHAQPLLKRADELRLVIPESLLREDQVYRKLHSGLTLSLVFRYELNNSDADQQGVTVVEVRYEPWDEIFYLRVAVAGQQVDETRKQNFEALCTWFQETGIPLALSPRTVATHRGFQLQVSIHPFSTMEQQRARRWVAASQQERANPVTTNPTSTKTPQATATLGGFILAGSIKRSAMLHYSWTLDIP